MRYNKKLQFHITLYTRFLVFWILTSQGFAQENNYKLAEGFYELSDFEMAAGLYLLEDQTFFHFASFGNVDLKIYGVYTLSNSNKINLKPDNNLTKPFYFYGYKNPNKTNSITFSYKQPYDQKAEKLFIEMDGKQTRFPEFSLDTETVSLSVKLPKAGIIKIGYNNSEKQNAFQYDILETTKLQDGINDIKIFHNYYAEMTVGVSKMTFNLENGNLTDLNNSNQKMTHKQEINQDIKNQILEFIAEQKSDTSIVRDEKVYQKLN